MKQLSQYFEQYLKEEFEPYLNSGISPITYRNMVSFLNILKEKDTPIESFDKSYVLEFWEFLKSKGHSITSTIPKRMTILKAFGKWMLREGYVSVNPCDLIRTSTFHEKYEVNRGLDKKDVRKLASAKLKGAHRRERDLFLLRMYTGMSWQETKHFHESWIKTLEDGTKMIIGNRGKTGIEFRIPINQEIDDLLKRTMLKDGTLPVTTNANQNEILKKIGEKLKLGRLHTHLSRHTTGTHYKSKGVPLEALKILMGHGSIQTTDKRYGQHDDEYLTKHFKAI